MESIYTCAHCGRQYPIFSMLCCGEDMLCEICADELTIVCDECGERFYTDSDANCSTDTLNLCRRCFNRSYTTCERCGRVIRREDVHYFASSDQDLCEDCYDYVTTEEFIHDYGYKPKPEFHGRDPRFFGVELEIDGGGMDINVAKMLLNIANQNADNLYIKKDGSLNCGMELVTHPMTIDYHMEMMPWGKLLEKARSMRYKSHMAHTCGLHIHISRKAFGYWHDEQEAAIARLIFFVEKFWPEMLRFSRRTQEQLNHWAARYGAKLTPTDQLKHVKNSCAGRYVAVNLQNRNTVEIRIFRGTLKLNTLLATLQMVNHLCSVAVSLTDEQLQDMGWYDFLSMVTEPELIQYLKERYLYVNEPVIAEGEV